MAARTSLRREALALYREILRTARAFTGQRDGAGRDYVAVLAASARREFEDARGAGAEEAARRVVVGREALYKLHDMVRWRATRARWRDAVLTSLSRLRPSMRGAQNRRRNRAESAAVSRGQGHRPRRRRRRRRP